MRIICCTDAHGGSGHYQLIREILFEYRFAGGLIVARLIIYSGRVKKKKMRILKAVIGCTAMARPLFGQKGLAGPFVLAEFAFLSCLFFNLHLTF